MSNIVEQPRYVCALGAQQTVLAIKNAIPITHAGPGCSSKMFQALCTHSGYQGQGYAGGSAIPSTNSSEKEVVFGGEGKLKDTIDGTLKVMKGDFFVVLTGCTADIVGDDVDQVVSEYRKRGIPVANAATGGFSGSNYKGHELVIRAIVDQLIGDVEPKVKKGLVNVFSVLPYQDTYWRGDLEAIKALLEKIGFEVNILFGNSSKGIEEWKEVPNAEFNLVLSPWAGLDTAKYLEKKYGTPYLHYPTLPIGAVETSNFLRTVGAFGKIEKQKVDDVIKQEEERFYDYLQSTVDFLTENRSTLPNKFYTIADSTYSLGITKFLVNELGLTPKVQYVVEEPSQRHLELIEKEFKNTSEDLEVKVLFENDGGKIHKDILDKYHKPKEILILGSSWEKNLVDEIKGVLLYVSLPINHKIVVNKTYVGYDGGLNLTEDIYSKVIERNTR
ncbi:MULTISPECIES: nitrogenase component 1 [unclassified Clostridium]|uniref:nitrogenase component 1 n=1 Tax=unclassified Clostridium TaxID=2614128 RepID=UPI0002981B68|nr:MULTISPECIES: nitrogenase component 1 [unclassified Clostridium]EKQ56812.1 MAG: nitrogenase molybdenum-iron protein, alpha and beta chain [Clostridium sp. Maddingley MBC34-26]